MTADDLRALAALVTDMPAVARLSPGQWGTVAVHLPGERIAGLRLERDRLAIHVVLAAGATVAEAAVEVAAAVALFVDPATVDLYIDDVADGYPVVGAAETLAHSGAER